MPALQEIPWVLHRLQWMREQRIWPNGLRYLWTDACGVMLLTSLWHATGDAQYISQAEWVVQDVYRVLGRPKGIRIGEEPDRDGQYMHYLTLWMSALARLGEVKGEYKDKGVQLVQQVHSHFVMPGKGVWWKMKEDLSGPYPGYGLGGLDPYDGLLAYTQLDPHGKVLGREQGEMRALVHATAAHMDCTQDLGLGMLLRVCSFFPSEAWARLLSKRCAGTLDGMWQQVGAGGAGSGSGGTSANKGYFARAPWAPRTRIAFSNYGASVGIQCAGLWPERVQALNHYFQSYRSGDEYDDKAITWVMACNSHFPGVMAPDDVSGLAKRPLLPGMGMGVGAGAGVPQAVKEGGAAGAAGAGQPPQYADVGAGASLLLAQQHAVSPQQQQGIGLQGTLPVQAQAQGQGQGQGAGVAKVVGAAGEGEGEEQGGQPSQVQQAR